MDILFIRHGETFESVEARLRDFLESILKPLEGHAQTVLVVAHGGILRTLTRIFDHRPLEQFWTADHQPNCCAHLLTCRNGELALARRGLLFYDEAAFAGESGDSPFRAVKAERRPIQ